MKKEIKVLMGNDVFLPDKDGVITCMDNYCRVLNDKIDIEAIAPKNRPDYVDDVPYKLTRCKSKKMPIVKMYYGKAGKDKEFKKHIYDQKFDIIHMHSPFGMSKFALKYAKKNNIPTVATFHSNMRPIFKSIVKLGFISEALVRMVGRTYNKFDEVFVCGPEIEKQARSFGYRGKITYVPFGSKLEKCSNPQKLIDEANEKFGIGTDEIVFLYVGRLMPLKRVDYTLDALKMLHDKGIRFKFYILGVGDSYQKRLEKQCKDFGFTDKEVIFWGMTEKEDMERIYSRADLFLFPSLYDNFGLVKVEAAAFSTPSVLIRDSAAAYGITHNVNGYLSDDTREDFATKIKEALSDGSRLKEVGKNAARDVYCSWEDCAPVLIENYKRIIDEKQRGVVHEKVAKKEIKDAKKYMKRQAKKMKVKGFSG